MKRYQLDMKEKILFIKMVCLGVIGIMIFPACGTQNVLTKAKKNGVMLEYSFPIDYQSYKQVQKIDQEIDAMGQLIEIDIVSELDFLLKKNADEGENAKLEVKVSSISMEMEIMGQQMGPDLSELNGKEFHMVVSNKGKEVDTHEADEIVFQVSPDEKSNLGMMFNSILPDLPDDPVKIGNTWTSRDSIYFKDGERYTLLVTTNTHTLNDYLEYEGVNCAEVKTKYEGYLKGKSYSQGTGLTFDGKINGDGIWYFDFENGRLIKDSSTGLADGKIYMDMSEMSMKRGFNNTTELVK